ncbi:MAG: DUF2625 family protein [Actinomycetaceae bacterium]|nr:DUF2625 family protein [Actinomycetaceae bacterium]
MSIWDELVEEVSRSTNNARILPLSHNRGPELAASIHVSEKSTLGSMIMNCGGILVDHGWLRLLAGGTDLLPDVIAASGGGTPTSHIIVGHDILGGLFAIDGGGLGINSGEVCYFAPDSLEWEGLNIGHTSFIYWALSGPNYHKFYSSWRWEGWEKEIQEFPLDRGIFVFPFLCSVGGTPDWETLTRKDVPISELHALYGGGIHQLAEQMDNGVAE